eukprot:m.118163 g.118163  ORF g.118163 m.118163 type:complete len:295 (-) comp28638_c0_seq1:388-1272(-)
MTSDWNVVVADNEDSEEEDDSNFGFADQDEDDESVVTDEASVNTEETEEPEFDEPDWTTEFTTPDDSDEDEEDGTGFGFKDGDDEDVDETYTLPKFSGLGSFTMLETIEEDEDEEEEEPSQPSMPEDLNDNKLAGATKSKPELPMDPIDFTKRGWLRIYVLPNGKRRPKRPKWKEKWCVLENGQLTFQTSCNVEVDPKENKVIEMSHFKEFYEDKSGGERRRFVMETFGQSTYYFLCIDADECNDWLSILFKAKRQQSRSREGTPKVKRREFSLKTSPLAQNLSALAMKLSNLQ